MSEKQQAAYDRIGSEWGYDVALQILNLKSKIGSKFEMPFSIFVHEHCTASGGDWVGMILTGIHDLSPRLYDTLPSSLGEDGNHAFANLIALLNLMGVDEV